MTSNQVPLPPPPPYNMSSPRSTLQHSDTTPPLHHYHKSSKERRVSFGEVHIREHAITVGDNPNVIGGLPLSLDWKHSPYDQATDIDDYEDLLGRRHRAHADVRRRRSITPLTAEERKSRLRNMGITKSQLRQAEIQRKIRLTSEWAYGRDQFGVPKIIPLETTKLLLQHYVV